ncbi:MAG: DNA translocase FtsK [Planctomycetes bacterium]|nr:DNA translocase FtsK [Planctomycetota bacterium]
MAGKTLSTRDTLSMHSVRKLLNKELVQECAALSLLLVVAFMILAIVSYDPADIAGAVWPVNDEPHNLGGRIGALVVHYAYTFLGVGTYLLVGVLGVYATLIFFRRKAADWPVRLIGTVMLVATFSAMFGDSYADSGIMPSRGGVIGTTIFGLLMANFGMTGAFLVLAFTMLLSFLLATDILFYPIIRDLLHPLGSDDEAISGPLTPPQIPDPIMPHELEQQQGGNWLTRLLKRQGPPADAEEADDGDDSDEDEDELTIDFEPDLALIPGGEPAPAPEPQQVGARRPVVEKPAPAPIETASGEEWEAALASYRLPEVAMLNAGKKRDTNRAKAEMTRCAEIIRATFAHFKMDVRVVDSIPGPTVTTYEMEIPPDVMLNKVERVKDNLALNLRVHGVRFVTQTGKSTVGIEVPNHTRDMVSFREILETAEFEAASKKMDLPMAFGKDALGVPVIRDLAAMPHLLVGGATGQGKSVFENVLLASLLMSRSPRDLRMVMVDPKQVEFAPYRDVPHLLAPVIDDSRRAVSVFEWLAEEMERRYTLFKHTGVRKMSEYNELSNRERRKRLEDAGADPESESHLPSIVAIVDELADLILVASDTKIDELIARIAAKARAAGIHLILVTQSPRADVLNGLIKSNIPARVSLRVNTGSESRIVLDQTGAEDLMGKGDLLMVMPGDPRAVRVQSAFIADDEMNRVLDTLRSQLKPNYLIDPARFAGGGDGAAAGGGSVGDLDPDFAAAVDQILAAGRGSASFLRTAMGLGHTRATRIIIQMERAGMLGPARGSKEREILISFEEWEARKAAGDLTGQGGVYDSMVAA